ncbi:MAG: L,D-transpeptidase family protein, partial [Syntrophales bacterium]|nr:L,D-transpeptidase family protein [Syntrophales bacterium]
LEINMERWRWLPDDFGSRYILTILPDLMLYVVDEGYTVISMKTVIGTPKQPSPIFSGDLTYLELNPTWNIPPSIVAKEIIPKVIRDPDYLQKKKIRIFLNWSESAPEVAPKNIKWDKIKPEKFPYRLTQDPGVNPLGRIKFMFPNEFDVYLHDTTERHLFHRRHRLYSHGCIRIEKPLELALWLLKGTELGSLERLKKEIRTGRRQKIELPQPISVHILYLTCWVDGNGVLHFRPDYYNYDTMIKNALKTLRPSSLPPEIPAP